MIRPRAGIHSSILPNQPQVSLKGIDLHSSTSTTPMIITTITQGPRQLVISMTSSLCQRRSKKPLSPRRSRSILCRDNTQGFYRSAMTQWLQGRELSLLCPNRTSRKSKSPYSSTHKSIRVLSARNIPSMVIIIESTQVKVILPLWREETLNNDQIYA